MASIHICQGQADDIKRLVPVACSGSITYASSIYCSDVSYWIYVLGIINTIIVLNKW